MEIEKIREELDELERIINLSNRKRFDRILDSLTELEFIE